MMTGAGISMPQPSNLPSGDNLTRIVWRWLFKSIPADPTIGKAAEARLGSPKDKERGLRLEQLLEVASRYVPLEQLVLVYEMMQGDFGFSHWALARLDVPVLTVNMDTMLEQADVHSIEHLHGVRTDSETVMTTISQYSEGLSSETQDKLRAAVEDKHLLVLGYSGRDRDVLPLLVAAGPSRVTWVRYWGEQLSEEVGAALRRLERGTSDDTVTVVEGSAQSYLAELLGVDPAFGLLQQASEPLSPSTEPTDELIRELRQSTDEDQRRLAVANILFELGLYEQARAILQQPLDTEPGRLEARKTIARSYRRQRAYWRSVATLLRPPLEYTPGQIANELIVALRHTSAWPIGVLMDRAIIWRGGNSPDERALAGARLAASRERQRAINSGNVPAALRGIDQALANAKGLDRQSRVDEATWAADAIALSGDYARALNLVETALVDAHYSDRSQHAYLLSKRLELRLTAGLIRAGALSDQDRMEIDDAADFAQEAAHDGAEVLWFTIVHAACLGASTDGSARRLLEEARSYLDAATGSERPFLLLHSAEQARFDGDDALCRRELVALRRALPRRVVGRGRSFRLAARLIELQADIGGRVKDDAALVARARDLQAEYRRAQIPAPAAWLDTTVALLENRDVEDGAITAMKQRGWDLEAARARHLHERAFSRWPIIV
ncbi:SIR2 family protein [Rathayibacter caricis]|nr:SIR2 family protein [Rathayibacter caricis]MCJ1697605.1 SIR2 family protein [Rathayibacter caricis]